MAQSSAMRLPSHRWFAAVYDCISKTDEKKITPIRRFVAGGANGRVLELGCSTGLNFEHYDWPNIEALEATEPDEHMLRRALRADALPTDVKSKLHLQQVPAERLPFEDASFDVALATLVFCTVSDAQRALQE